MGAPDLVNLTSLIDDAKCFALVRQHRWPDGVRCPGCGGDAVVRHGRDDTQPHRQRYRCKRARAVRRPDRDRPGRAPPAAAGLGAVPVLHGPEPLQRADRPGAGALRLDVQVMTEQLRDGLAARNPAARWTVRWSSTRSTSWPGTRATRRRGKKGRLGRRRRLAGAPGRGTLAKEKPPILGMIQRGGQVVLQMLANVQQKTIRPIIGATVARHPRLHRRVRHLRPAGGWGYRHKTVCHGRGEYARDEDGDGFCEVHVNTMEGFWSLLRSWLRPHRGISQEKLPLYLGFFEFVHNARRRGRALLGDSWRPWSHETSTPKPGKSVRITLLRSGALSRFAFGPSSSACIRQAIIPSRRSLCSTRRFRTSCVRPASRLRAKSHSAHSRATH